MKLNIKTLLVVLVILIGVFIFAKFYRAKKTERTFRTEFFQIDTAKVQTILLYPRADKQKEIRFKRNGRDWSVTKDNFTTDADVFSVQNLLNELVRIKPERLAAKSKDKWMDMQINDTMGTRVKVIEEGNKVTCDLMIGKLNFQQRNQMPGQFQGFNKGGGNVSGTTFVRLSDEVDVYAVNGFLPMTFNQGFNAWRNKDITRFTKSSLTKLTFQYPADSGFVLAFIDSTWQINGAKADSLKTDQFLNQLAMQTSTDYIDDYTPKGTPLYQLTIEGNNMTAIVVQCFNGRSDDELIVNSSRNPKSYFTSKQGNLTSRIFKGRIEFVSVAKQ